ncbi:MAG: methyltransferase type 12, partial [Desulfobulbus sp.]|nr:methyltransferase type 12 [Desulfobulbus sp.]
MQAGRRGNTGPCIVCGAGPVGLFATIDGLRYHRCTLCQATFLDPGQRLCRADEHRRYRLHENDPADPGYRRFLARLGTPLVKRLQPGSSGLDYGCGPEPVLAGMLAEAGHRVRVYDPLFFPDRAPLADSYDFITCTEV